MELDAEDVEGELEDVKKYLEDGNRTINLLESDVNSELSNYRIRTVAKTSGAAAMIMIAGGTLIHFRPLKQLSADHSVCASSFRFATCTFSTVASSAVQLDVELIMSRNSPEMSPI